MTTEPVVDPTLVNDTIPVHVFGPVFGEYLGVKLLRIHSRFQCKTEFCAAHNPSTHHMNDWPMAYRADRGIWERRCVHDVWHFDPDNLDSFSAHGCDGCCVPDYVRVDNSKPEQ